MSVLKLPSELLQGIIDDAVRDTELHRVLRFRETCRQFPRRLLNTQADELQAISMCSFRTRSSDYRE